MPLAMSLKDPLLARVNEWFLAVSSHDLSRMDDLLAHGVPVDVPHPLHHTTALMEATRRGNAATVHWLLARSAAPVFLCGLPLGTPLHCAIKLHHAPIAALLLKAASHAAITDATGRTPLHLLVGEAEEFTQMADVLDLAAAIIAKDCPIDAIDKEGLTALHYAVVQDQPALAELLLAEGADANARVPDTGMSPLGMAALDRNGQLAALLLRFGADPHLPLHEGRTPASIYPALTRIDSLTTPPRRPKPRRRPAN